MMIKGCMKAGRHLRAANCTRCSEHPTAAILIQRPVVSLAGQGRNGWPRQIQARQ